MKAAKRKRWKDTRKGFKHELVCILVERGFSFRQAEKAVNAIFSSIKAALLRRESINVHGFGQWYVEQAPREKIRAWRFGKVILRKPYKVSFEMDPKAFSQHSGEPWNPHPSWAARCKKRPKLRGRQLLAHLEEQEHQRQAKLLDQYTRMIVSFVQNQLYCEDVQQFWILRDTPWFYGQVSEIPVAETRSVAATQAAELIRTTKSGNLPRTWPNGIIEAVRWYARWSTRLEVEPDIWREAEQFAKDVTLRRR